MFTNSNIILFSIIGFIILLLIIKSNNKDSEIPFEHYDNKNNLKKKYEKTKNINTNNNLIDIFNNNKKMVRCLNNLNDNVKINPNFVDIKFHNDYRDITTAIKNIISPDKHIFNENNDPVETTKILPTKEINDIVNDFIDLLNKNLNTQVSENRTQNSGWDEDMPQKTVESGWDKIQKSLGLPVSLYNDPAKKGKVNIIKINNVIQQKSCNEIQYKIDLILQKENVEDQMMLNLVIIQQSIKSNKIIIKNIDIIGYLSENTLVPSQQFQDDYQLDKEQFYIYDDLQKDDITDLKIVQNILIDKYNKTTKDKDFINSLLDEPIQNYHKDLPSLDQLPNIKITQTIFDDFNNKKKFY